jgi:hypothetical protein
MLPPQVASISRPQAVAIWSALAALVALAVAVAVVMSGAAPPDRPADPDFAQVLLLVLAVTSAGDLVAGAVVIRSMRQRAGDEAAAVVGTQTVVAGALAVGVGIFSSIVYWLTRDPRSLAFAAGAGVALVWWFPGERRWARLCGTAAPRPLLRE